MYLTGYGPSSTDAVQLNATWVAPVPVTLSAGALGAVRSRGIVAVAEAAPDRFPDGSTARIVNV